MRRAFSLEMALYASFLLFLLENVQSLQTFCRAPLAYLLGSFWRSRWFISTLRAQLYLVCMLHICMRSSSLRDAITGRLCISPSVSHCPRLGLLPRRTGSRRTSLREFVLALSDLPCLGCLAGSCLAELCTPVRCKLCLCTASCLPCWRLAVVFAGVRVWRAQAHTLAATCPCMQTRAS